MSLKESGGPCCTVCSERYDSEKVLPLVLSCGHSICIMCDEDPTKTITHCPTCEKEITTRVKNIAVIDALKYTSDLRKSIEKLKNPELDYKCPTCKKWKLEKNMHICKNCVIDEGLLDLTGMTEEERRKRVLEVSMCGVCALTHLFHQKEHKTVQMFSILVSHTYSSLSSTIESSLEKLKDDLNLLSHTFSDFKDIGIKAVETYNSMSGMARDSDSTKQQKALFEKMDDFFNETRKFNTDTQSMLKNRKMMLQESIENIEEWCKTEKEKYRKINAFW